MMAAIFISVFAAAWVAYLAVVINRMQAVLAALERRQVELQGNVGRHLVLMQRRVADLEVPRYAPHHVFNGKREELH
jgi:hypothetical protein